MAEEFPRARRDLEVSHQHDGEKEFVVVKDPISRRYLRLRPPEWWLVEQMDGRRALSELETAFAERFGSQLPPGMLAGFVAKLEALHVLETPEAEKASTSLSERQTEDSGLGRLLFVKLKAINPDRWLGVWAQRLRFLMRPWFWPVSLIVIAGALWVVAENPDAFRFDIASIFSAGSIVAIILSMFLVLSLHEIAHGVVCRHLGGHVHEMGFLLLYFQPCLYCDLSDSWLFKERWKKLLVTFSGAYFQILLGALGVWGWRITAEGTMINHFFWMVAVISLVNVLFNFNPLIKLDGYYLLSDWLGIPNLRARAFRWVGHIALGRPWPYAQMPSRREQRSYWLYGIGAVVYSVVLIGYIAYWTLHWAIVHWKGAGLVLYVLALAVIFRRPLVRAMGKRVPRSVYNVRRIIFWSVVGVVILLALVVPFQYRVGSPARLEPWAQMTIFATDDGYVLSEWYDRGEAQLRKSQISKMVTSGFTTLGISHAVQVGDSISIGDTLLRVAGDQFVSLRDEAEATLRAKQAELDLLLAPPRPEEIAAAEARIEEEQSLLTQATQVFERTRSLYERKMTAQSSLEQAEAAMRAQEARLETARQQLAVLKAPPKTEQVRQLQADVERLKRQMEFYSGQLESTVFTSKVNGRVIRLADRAGEICRVARTDSVRCVMSVDEAYAPLLKPDQLTTLKIPSYPFSSYAGRLMQVSRIADSGSHAATFRAVAAIANTGELNPGMTGYAKVATGKHTLAWRVVRRVVRFFRIEFWSWW